MIVPSPEEEPTVVGDVAWGLFAETMASDLKATDDYPTRYLIETFPIDTQLEMMLSQGDRSQTDVV